MASRTFLRCEVEPFVHQTRSVASALRSRYPREFHPYSLSRKSEADQASSLLPRPRLCSWIFTVPT